MDDVSDVGLSGSLPRAVALLRALAARGGEGMRLTNAAEAAGVPPASAHRLLRILIDEGLVEQDARNKYYRLGIEFFSLAARAGNPGNLREVCRPALLRLSVALGDTVFLLVRSGYDAVCLDRCEGPVPIRSFTGDIGGKVILGVGQGSMAILAYLPESEREEVIRVSSILARLTKCSSATKSNGCGKAAAPRAGRGSCRAWPVLPLRSLTASGGRSPRSASAPQSSG